MADKRLFDQLNVQILAISADTTFSQKMFAQSMELNYPLLSDHPNLTTIQQFDVLKRVGDAKRPVARGSYFLIDKDGIVRGKWMGGGPGKVFPSEVILKVAREIQN
jgi:peroxiredoxin